MRTELEKMGSEERHTFTGVFERYGKKSAFKGKDLTTILLKQVKNEAGEIVADHIWLNETSGFKSLKLTEGDLIQFDGRVTEYQKGYFGYRDYVYKPAEWDFKISYPTKIKKLN